MLPALEMVTPVEPYEPPTWRVSTFVNAVSALMVVALANVTVWLLIVAVPVAAPRVRVVAAPPMLRVVAVVLNTSNDDESVRREVVNVGEVLYTTTPVPVSSVRVLARTLDVPE